jgi:hypothetical protein
MVSVRTSQSRPLQTVSRPTKVLSRSHLRQLGQCLSLGVGTERLGLGLEGLMHILNNTTLNEETHPRI